MFGGGGGFGTLIGRAQAPILSHMVQANVGPGANSIGAAPPSGYNNPMQMNPLPQRQTVGAPASPLMPQRPFSSIGQPAMRVRASVPDSL